MNYDKLRPVNETFKLIKATPLIVEQFPNELDVSDVHFDGKTAVILCGNNTKSNSRASYYAHTFFGWLKDFPESSNLAAYSLFYPSTQPLQNSFIPNLELDYESLTQEMFKSILSDKTATPESIAKRFKDIIFFGHSAGGYVMNEITNSLIKEFFSREFSDSDIQKILNNIVFVAYAPHTLVEAPIQSVYIAPVYDSVGSTQLTYESLLNSNDVKSSNPNIKFNNKNKISALTYFDFFSQYKELMADENIVLFSDKTKLIATPTLLYIDGISEEDHNLAGVANTPMSNKRKTEAGKITTTFIQQVLAHALFSKTKSFKTQELFNKLINDPQINKNLSQSQKEKQ